MTERSGIMTRLEFLAVITSIHALLRIGEVDEAKKILEKLMKEAETKEEDQK